MKATLPRLRTSHLTADARALLRCQTALDLKDRGEYFAAQEVMRPLWKGMGTSPATEGLHPTVAAEVLLCVGTLTRWIGSRNQVKEAQTIAKDLITESITIFESLGDVLKIAAAHSELAYCYWREGAFSEARIWFNEALQRLTTEGATRANALLGLAVVEWADTRYAESLRVLTTNAPLFEKINNYTLKGAYHTQLAIVLRNLVTAENRSDYLQRAVNEYQQADKYFRVARNVGFRADVTNNLGNLLRQLGRFEEADARLNEARRLAVSIKDKIRVAQFDDTRAQLLIDQGRFAEAETIARRTVAVLEKTDHYCLLAEMLITHGITLARLPDDTTERAHIELQRAIAVALRVDAYNKAGLAALTLIEELAADLSPEIVVTAYYRADEWLSALQGNQDVQLRLSNAARKVLGQKPLEFLHTVDLAFASCNLRDEVRKFEGTLIRRALIATNGSVTRAGALLGMTHQALAPIIAKRHPELLKVRSPVHRRSRQRET